MRVWVSSIVGVLSIVGVMIAFSVYTKFFMNGNQVNRLERQTFISHGSNTFEVTILNGGGPVKVYKAVSKITSEEIQGYYFFWAEVKGKRVYVQSPIASTLIEELP